MKTIYIKQNGGKVTITVSDEQYKEIKNLRREQWRNDSIFKYHNYSIEERMEQGCDDFANDSLNPEMLFDRLANEKQKALKLSKLRQGLKMLSDKQASAIHKHFFLGMSYAEIAVEEGIGKSTVTDRIQSALKKLKKLF